MKKIKTALMEDIEESMKSSSKLDKQFNWTTSKDLWNDGILNDSVSTPKSIRNPFKKSIFHINSNIASIKTKSKLWLHQYTHIFGHALSEDTSQVR